MTDRRFTDAELDAAVQRLTEPGRLQDAEAIVEARAPALQRILAEALHAAGWFGASYDASVRAAAAHPDEADRVVALRTLLAEESRIGMLVGVAVGWELARELEFGSDGGGDEPGG
jgi:hypothetical protein